MKMQSQTKNAWMNSTGGKLKWQTKQSLICLDFCTTTEKEEASKAELGFTVTQPRATELLSGIVLPKEGGLHMALTAPLQPQFTAQHRCDILAIVVSCKEKTNIILSAPLIYIETHVLKADFKLLKVDKSKGRTCPVANTFSYYSDLEAAEVR